MVGGGSIRSKIAMQSSFVVLHATYDRRLSKYDTENREFLR